MKRTLQIPAELHEHLDLLTERVVTGHFVGVSHLADLKAWFLYTEQYEKLIKLMSYGQRLAGSGPAAVDPVFLEVSRLAGAYGKATVDFLHGETGIPVVRLRRIVEHLRAFDVIDEDGWVTYQGDLDARIREIAGKPTPVSQELLEIKDLVGKLFG